MKGVDSIDNLVDVDTSTTAPTDGQPLVWDATAQAFIPGAASGGSSYEVETIVATAGQTSFALSKFAIGDINFARNGSTLPMASATAVGQAVTYDPAGNAGESIDAGDEITISYIASTVAPNPTNVISDNVDVDTAGAVIGDGLIFDGTEWKPGDITAVSTVVDLTDTLISTPQVGDLLAWDGTQWVNQSPAVQPAGGLIQMQAYQMFFDPEVSIYDSVGVAYAAGTDKAEIYIDVDFIPKSANSIITILHDAEFRISGSGADEYTSVTTEVNSGVSMRFVRQTSVNASSEMGRSNILLPLTSVYKNTSLSTKKFRLYMSRTTGDDVLRMWNGIVTITEVQK